MNNDNGTAPVIRPALLRAATLAMLEGFRERRAYIRTEAPAHEREVRKLAADCARWRRKHWGYDFTRNHEWPIWNRREYVLMFAIFQRVRN